MAGRLDASQAATAESVLGSVPGSVTVDLHDLDYISSAGLGVFISAHNRLTKEGRALRLIHLSNHVRHIFTLARLDQLLNIE